MDTISLTINDISRLNRLKKNLTDDKALTNKDKESLLKLLRLFPTAEILQIESVTSGEIWKFRLWEKQIATLNQWRNLFGNMPGKYLTFCYLVEEESSALLEQNVIIVATFLPSISFALKNSGIYYEIHLKDDGTAKFSMPSSADEEHHPELYNFKGTWKEAYLLLIETLKKGWPMEEFPEELLPLLKK